MKFVLTLTNDKDSWKCSPEAWLLSDGTLRMLALTLMAYAKRSAQLILIEEPENGVHPRALQAVVQSLSSVYDGQLFCATHSPLVLSLINRNQLLCFGKAATGAIDIVQGSDHPALKVGMKKMVLLLS